MIILYILPLAERRSFIQGYKKPWAAISTGVCAAFGWMNTCAHAVRWHKTYIFTWDVIISQFQADESFLI